MTEQQNQRDIAMAQVQEIADIGIGALAIIPLSYSDGATSFVVMADGDMIALIRHTPHGWHSVAANFHPWSPDRYQGIQRSLSIALINILSCYRYELENAATDAAKVALSCIATTEAGREQRNHQRGVFLNNLEKIERVDAISAALVNPANSGIWRGPDDEHHPEDETPF